MAQEQRYQNFAYICANRGLVALYANDRLPDHTYMDMSNLEVRQENAISMRFGHIPVTAVSFGSTPVSGGVLSLGRLRGLTQSWRYAKTNAGLLFRGPGAGAYTGSWAEIAAGLNPTNRTSFVQAQTPFSANPFMLVADSNVMLKDDGTTETPWGYPFPLQPASGTPFIYFDNWPQGGHVGARGEWFLRNTDYTINGSAGTSNQPNLITDTGTIESTNNNCWIIKLNVAATVPTAVFEGLWQSSFGGLFIEHVDITGSGTSTDPFTAATAYCSPFSGATPPPVGAGISLAAGVVMVALPASANATTSVQPVTAFASPWNLAWPSNTSGYAVRLQCQVINPAQVARIRINLSFNDTSFTNYAYYDISGTGFTNGITTTIICPLSQFTIVGTPNFSNVSTFRIDIVTASNISGSEVFLFSLLTWFTDSAFPSSFGGLPYDYRAAGYNANTGTEGPSTQIVGYGGPTWHAPYVNQHPILVYVPDFTAPGFTHYRVYRRGGTLPNSWQMVGQVPISEQVPGYSIFIDTMSDPIAATQPSLAIDNYPPITSTLPRPINATFAQAAAASSLNTPTTIYPTDMTGITPGQLLQIGQGSTSETVPVISVGPNYFTAYLQFPHQIGEVIFSSAKYQASANIACAAFERIFVGGDPQNPWRLYYSAVGQPESFPPENWIDLPGEAEVIMGMAFTQGLLFVGTLTGWHKVISVNGSIPIAVKTNARHGLFGVNALEVGEGVIQYLSYDGIYLFNGTNSTEFSHAVQWVFRSYLQPLAGGPIPEAGGPISVMDSSDHGRTLVNIGYDKSEIFVSYLGLEDQTRHRIIYSQRDNRWREDDIVASAQLYEEDTATLIYGDDNGMIYLDRFGDQDINVGGGSPVPINVRLATASLDQGQPKNPKNYQEHTIDINTNSQDVQVWLLLDNQTTAVNLGTVNTQMRQQVNFNVNNGLGMKSLNVAFFVMASLTANIDIFELHLKAVVDAETRQSFDTYWTKYGVEEWKLVKQGYFEYTATDTVVINCYTDGEPAIPTFGITLPPAPNRTIVWRRFPAVMAKLWRWVATSSGDFTMYETSHIEVKPVCGTKGYARQPLAA